MRQVDLIRNQCLEQLEQTYAVRLTQLVDELRLEDAESVMQEMVIEDDIEDADWTFMDDLTEFNNEDLDNIEFEQIE